MNLRIFKQDKNLFKMGSFSYLNFFVRSMCALFNTGHVFLFMHMYP